MDKPSTCQIIICGWGFRNVWLSRFFSPEIFSVAFPQTKTKSLSPEPSDQSAMAAVSKLHLSPQPFHHFTFKDTSSSSFSNHLPKFRQQLRRNQAKRDGLFHLRQRNGRCQSLRQPCRAFRSEKGGESTEKRIGEIERDGIKGKDPSQSKKSKGVLYSLKSLLLRVSGSEKSISGEKCQSTVAKLEEMFFSVSFYIYIYFASDQKFVCYWLFEILLVLEISLNCWFGIVFDSKFNTDFPFPFLYYCRKFWNLCMI